MKLTEPTYDARRDDTHPAAAAFLTRDTYLAAFFTIYDIPLLAVYQIPGGRTEFVFDNTGDAALRLWQDFREDTGNDLVSVHAFRRAYRTVMDAVRAARAARPTTTEDAHHDDAND